MGTGWENTSQRYLTEYFDRQADICEANEHEEEAKRIPSDHYKEVCFICMKFLRYENIPYDIPQ